jgi:hypothetical protein
MRAFTGDSRPDPSENAGKFKRAGRRGTTLASVGIISLVCWMALGGGCQSGDTTESTDQGDDSSENVGEAHLHIFTNGDFETGTAGAAPPNWTLATYLASSTGVTLQTPQTRAGLNLQTGGTAQTQEVVGNGPLSLTDPKIGTAGTLRVPAYGNKCVYINMNPGSSNNVNAIR